jgi:hypothetical protein
MLKLITHKDLKLTVIIIHICSHVKYIQKVFFNTIISNQGTTILFFCVSCYLNAINILKN